MRSEYQQQSPVNSQNTEDDLNILLKILSIPNSIITSLINLCEWPLYAWTSLYTCRIRTATESRLVRQSSCSIGRGAFNPHLESGFSFLRVREHRVPGAQISEYRETTIRGIFRGVVIRRRSLIYLHTGDDCWKRYDLEAFARLGREVECQKETRREREK
jgi:hypothetical protein